MRATPKNVKYPEPHAGDSSLMSLLTEWVRQGTESFFATQRIFLDLVSRQNANVMHAIRDGIATTRPGPATALTELAGEAITNFISAQKVLLSLAHEQNQIVCTGVKERVPAPAGALTDLLRRSVDTFIEMQQNFLTIAEKQTSAWTESAKDGKLYMPKLTEIAREGLDNFVKTQKKFLDVIAEETAHATGGNGNGVHKTKKTALTELAQEGADAFIAAQKKLLDLAGQQIALNLKAGSKVVAMAPPFPTETITNLTRDTVETFVAAQRSLLDVVTKPRHAPQAASRHTKPVPPPRRPAHKAGRKTERMGETAQAATVARAN